MFAGRIVERGPSPAIIRNPRHPYSQLLLSALPMPGKRMTAASGGGFDQRADAVRRLSQSPGELGEVAPGHYVRSWTSEAAA